MCVNNILTMNKIINIKTLPVNLHAGRKPAGRNRVAVEKNKSSSVKPQKWTIIHFILDLDDLEQNLLDGEKKLPGENIEVLTVELSGSGKVRKEFMEASGKLVEKKINPEMSSLPDFLKWTAKTYSAQHYMLEFDGHSSEIRPLLGKIRQGMKDAGKKIDIIKFASCTMAHLDIANQFKDTANYMIASQDFSECDDYLNDLKKWAKKHPEKLDSAIEVSEKIIEEDEQKTHSIINLKKIPQFDEAVKSFGREILKIKMEDLKEFNNTISNSRHFAQNYPPLEKSPLLDIKGMVENLESSTYFLEKYPELVNSAAAVKKLLDETVVGEKSAEDMWLLSGNTDTSCGLSLFIPVKPNYRHSYLYNSRISFWKETGWDKVMKHMTQKIPAQNSMNNNPA